MRARLGVGIQGLGLTEVAYQNAVAYAKDRLQMRSLAGPRSPDKPADPIIVHPDVRRMLLTARAYAEGGRAFAYWVALMADTQLSHPDDEVRKYGADMMSLLTPIVKAFMTDNGFLCASECLQVFGGHGYIAEWGMEQYVRDARINMIYEGTNTIQSLDLLGRKILMDNGAKLRKFGKMVTEFVEENGTHPDMAEFITPLADIGNKVQQLTMELGMKALPEPRRGRRRRRALPARRRSLGLLRTSWRAWPRLRSSVSAPMAVAWIRSTGSKLMVARFYFQRLLPETAMLIRSVARGPDDADGASRRGVLNRPIRTTD